MSEPTETRTFSSASEARKAVRSLELDGIDGSHINLETPPVDRTDVMSVVDAASMRRPARRYLMTALAVAAAVAAIMAVLVLVAGLDARFVLPAVIAAFLCGGLFGLYSKLSMHRDLPDADAPGPVQIRVPSADYRRANADVLN